MNFYKNLLWKYASPSVLVRVHNRFRWAGRGAYVLGWLEEHNLYVATSGKTSIALGRRERLVQKYRRGVSARFERLRLEYMLDSVTLSDHDLVVDVGANVGEVALAILETTKCRIVAIEPSASEFRALKYNLRGTDSVLVMAAAWKDDLTPVMFFDGNTTGDSSIIQNEQSTSVESIMARTLDAILDQAGLSDENIQLLKIDAEGAEPEVLLGAPKALKRTVFVAVDAGPERGTEGESTVAQCDAILRTTGFRLIGYYHRRAVLLYEQQ